MKYIALIILSLIFSFGIIQANEDANLDKNIDDRREFRRNVIVNDVPSSDIVESEVGSTFFGNIAEKLFRHTRDDTDSTSLACAADADCKYLSKAHVCVHTPSLTVGICIPKPIGSIATTMINIKNIIYAIILSLLVLIIN